MKDKKGDNSVNQNLLKNIKRSTYRKTEIPTVRWEGQKWKQGKGAHNTSHPLNTIRQTKQVKTEYLDKNLTYIHAPSLNIRDRIYTHIICLSKRAPFSSWPTTQTRTNSIKWCLSNNLLSSDMSFKLARWFLHKK